MTMQELEENKILIDEILGELRVSEKLITACANGNTHEACRVKDNMEALESGNADIDAVNVGISLAIYSAAKGMCERNLAANTSPRWETIDCKYYGLSRFFA